ncbi:uncharacterized protein TRIADDRAFT_22586, partial [Trichoplax adhaerens]
LPWATRRYLKWKSSNITPNVIKQCIHRSGFRLTKGVNEWLGYWGKHMKSEMFKTVKEYQKVNHYPGSFQIGRKDRLWRNMFRMQATNGRAEFGFVPQTYVLPQDMKHLKQIWDDSGKQKWILKPPASARGNGIKVINRWAQIPKKKPVLVQKYLSRPYLINGCKFDLRVYAYVSSVDPLRIYIFDDGLVRFCTVKYSSSMKFLSNRFMHLTNYSINKFNQDFTQNDDADICQGHKWSLKALWDFMKKGGINTDNIWKAIQDIVTKTIICCEPSMYTLVKANVKKEWSCHELFGFDIILDDKLKPWLLEVNISPSLHSNSTLDRDIKGAMVRDLLNVACFPVPDKKTFRTNSNNAVTNNTERRFHYGQLTADEKAKHLFYVQKHLDGVPTILDILTADDIRVLMEVEDEYNKRGRFQRIFPSLDAKYDKYFEQSRYYNILAGEWYRRYRSNYHARAVSLLQIYCKRGLHLHSESSDGTHKV